MKTTRTEGFSKIAYFDKSGAKAFQKSHILTSQGQSIGGEIIRPRDRAAHGTKREKICRTARRLAEGGIKSPSITKLYLVGTIDRWNDSKQAEERDRVKHEPRI